MQASALGPTGGGREELQAPSGPTPKSLKASSKMHIPSSVSWASRTRKGSCDLPGWAAFPHPICLNGHEALQFLYIAGVDKSTLSACPQPAPHVTLLGDPGPNRKHPTDNQFALPSLACLIPGQHRTFQQTDYPRGSPHGPW